MSFEKQNQIIYNSQSENISIILSYENSKKKNLKKTGKIHERHENASNRVTIDFSLDLIGWESDASIPT